MSVAARVAGWQRRLGGQPGPFGVPGGSGDSPNGTNVEVELFIDGVWVDITSYVMTRDGSGKVSISRGQANEGNRTDPGRCSFQINNRDGRFSPRNPVSPYFGLIGRNTPIRVSVPSGNEKSYRFWGEVASWPQRWDTTGTDVWVDLEAAGILRRLGQGQTPLKSPMRREFSNPSRVSIVGYWPCEDGPDATQVASALVDGQPMTFTAGVELAAYSGWVASEPLPTIGAGSMTGAVTDYTATTEFAARFFVRLPDAGIASGTPTVISFFGTGTAPKFTLYTDGPGGLGLKGYSSFGNVLFDSGLFAFNANGIQMSVGVELVQSGADVQWEFFAFDIDRSTLGSAFSLGSVSGTLVGHTFGEATSVRVGGEGDLGDTVVGHIALADDVTAYASTSAAMVAWVNEDPNARVVRLCREEMIDFLLVSDGKIGNTVTLGPQGTKTFLEIVTESFYADDSILIEPTTVLGIGRRTRLSRFNQSAALSLVYTAFQLSEVPTPVDDDQHTRNDITATRPNGSSAQVMQTDGPLSVSPPPQGVGRYDESITTNVFEDADLPHQAGWHLHLGTVDEARFPRISVNLAHPSFTGSPTLRQQALAVRPGDRLTISDPPAWLPPDDISQLVIGFTETIDNFQHRITYTCVPESPYRVGLLDSATLGRLDTGGSSLVVGVTATATSLSVATPGVVWTTDVAEFPFDIRVGGEVMTVTAISGATSPQTFTVTRSINGVVKAQPVGADVRLDQPMILSL